MNRRAFVPINRKSAGRSSLKAFLSRFNIVSTAEYECSDGLQTEELFFWDCELHEDQRSTIMGILSEKKEYIRSQLQSS
jgi:hypothetical protein